MKKAGIAFVLLSVWCFSAVSTIAGGVGITLKAGTLGFGGDLAIGLTENLGIRAGYTMLDYDETLDLDDAMVDASISLAAIPLFMDFFPAGGAFRITVGGIINNNEIALSADPKEPLELEGTHYGIESLTGSIEFSKFSPYVGIGCGNAISKDSDWYFSCDIGLMFHGSPEAGASAVASGGVDQGQLNNALDAEVSQFNDDIAWFTVYPLVSAGMSFRF